jgi:antitoxin component YwqK of YwqJK toxin-antitoxin module
MKKLLLLILLILIGCSEPEPLNYQLLTERDGVHYRKDTNEIYSGPVFNIEGKSTGYIKKGKFYGPVKSYNENGQLELEETYKDGKLINEKKFYYNDNGQLKDEMTFKDGIPNGPYKRYYDNGQLQDEGTFKDGGIDGPYKVYYENGQLMTEGTYKDNQLEGTYKDYLDDGKLELEQTYKDGKLIDSKEY